MTISENFELLRAIFTKPKIVPDISRLQLFSVIKRHDIEHLYLGNRINYSYHLFADLTEKEKNGRSGHTLFFHDDNDHFYYDVLDENTKCLRQYEKEITVFSHVCTDIEPLQECIKQKIKKKGGKK